MNASPGITAFPTSKAVCSAVWRLPKDDPRRGILGKGSVLLVTSAANRTSPVQRGAVGS